MITQKEFTFHKTSYCKKVTVYRDLTVMPRASILYFHGGGLLYGSRTDLPSLHLRMLTSAGYIIVAYDYPLAPAAKLDLILSDVIDSVNHYIQNTELYMEQELPFFLWGRSAGAYLCLIASSTGKFLQLPNGILSYYGYGFLCDNWFRTPSPYYNSLPPIPESCLSTISSKLYAQGNLDTHYSIYVYARQTGTWKSLFYEGREKYFFLDYSLRTCKKLPCPLFCAHSIHDTDVPYSEFLELCSRYDAQRFVASAPMHDFDRDEKDTFTLQLLESTLHFLEEHLESNPVHVKI
ncbi:MAG: alpha/beta hydrolase [Lachnospiraceae bacterium]